MCSVISSAQIECPSPAVNIKLLMNSSDRLKGEQNRQFKWRRSPLKFQETHLAMQIGFIMDNVEAVKDLEKHFKNLRSQLLYVEDPKFFQFPNMVKSYKGDTLVIEVRENLNESRI